MQNPYRSFPHVLSIIGMPVFITVFIFMISWNGDLPTFYRIFFPALLAVQLVELISHFAVSAQRRKGNIHCQGHLGYMYLKFVMSCSIIGVASVVLLVAGVLLRWYVPYQNSLVLSLLVSLVASVVFAYMSWEQQKQMVRRLNAEQQSGQWAERAALAPQRPGYIRYMIRYGSWTAPWFFLVLVLFLDGQQIDISSWHAIFRFAAFVVLSVIIIAVSFKKSYNQARWPYVTDLNQYKIIRQGWWSAIVAIPMAAVTVLSAPSLMMYASMYLLFMLVIAVTRGTLRWFEYQSLDALRSGTEKGGPTI